RIIYSYIKEDGLKRFKMNRLQSLIFLLKNLGDNIILKRATLLPDDEIVGFMDFSAKPPAVPHDAQYLGGVGEGAWFSVSPSCNNKYIIKRFTSKGELEYVVLGETVDWINISRPFEISYDSNFLFTHVTQDGCKIRINHLQRLPTNYLSNKNHLVKLRLNSNIEKVPSFEFQKEN